MKPLHARPTHPKHFVLNDTSTPSFGSTSNVTTEEIFYKHAKEQFNFTNITLNSTHGPNNFIQSTPLKLNRKDAHFVQIT